MFRLLLPLSFVIFSIVVHVVRAQQRDISDISNLPDGPGFEQWMSEKIVEYRSSRRQFREADIPDTIPVVFHVIHKGEPYGYWTNIPDERIHDQVEVLNECFNLRNSDTINIHPDFKDLIGNMYLYFVLARRDPEGNPTTGIVRVEGQDAYYDLYDEDERIRAANESHWPQRDYLNIWVTDLAMGLYGWGVYPDYKLPGMDYSTDSAKVHGDGIFLDYTAVGSKLKHPEYGYHRIKDMGRAAVHEIGHFLGLYHVWGEGGTGHCFGNDYVDDTPEASISYSYWDPERNRTSCGSFDNVENYMFYTPDCYMSMFTKGQVERMRVVLENAPRRASLLVSKGAITPVYDIAAVESKYPSEILCEGQMAPQLTVKNEGNTAVDSLVVYYRINSDSWLHHTVSGRVEPGSTMDIKMPQKTLGDRGYRIDFRVAVPRRIEHDTTNNVLSRYFVVNSQRKAIPYVERFETSRSGWSMLELEEETMLVSPLLDLSAAGAASMRYRSLDSGIRVQVSAGCDRPFEDLDTDHRNVADLSMFAGKDSVRVLFTAGSMGRPVDLVEFFVHGGDKVVEVQENGFKLYPNPASNKNFRIAYNFGEWQDVEVLIYNAMGSLIAHHTHAGVLNQIYEYDLSEYSSGVYMVKVLSDNMEGSDRLVVGP